jgi:hypothetical protein
MHSFFMTLTSDFAVHSKLKMKKYFLHDNIGTEDYENE